MTCPRPGCLGLVILYRDTELPGWPVYCINCGWYGDRRNVTDLDGFGARLLSTDLPPTSTRRARILSEDHRQKIALSIRAAHARNGHKCSPPPDDPNPSPRISS